MAAKKNEANDLDVVVHGQMIVNLKRRADEESQNPFLLEVNALVIADAVDYQVADGRLGVVCQQRSKLKDDLYEPIEEAKKALNKLTALFKRVDGPWEAAEKLLRRKMADYKNNERVQAARLKAADEERARQAAAAAEAKRREAEEKARAAVQERDEALRRVLEEAVRKQREEARTLERNSMIAAAAPRPEPVKAAGSTERVVKRWRLTDLNEFILAVANQDIPVHMADVNRTNINNHFSIRPQEVAEWPGIEVYEDTVIARK